MLVSVELALTPTQDADVPAHLGTANYRLALERLSLVSPGLGRRIHDLPGLKPLTCSGLMGGYARKGGMGRLRAGRRYWLRVTGLTEEVSTAIVEGFVQDPPASWELQDERAGVTFRVIGAASGEETGWCGQSSYEELVWRSMANEDQERRMTRMTLQFASPTAFSSKGTQVALPLPGLVFGSLAERWAAFSPVPLSPWLKELSEQWVEVSRFDLKSLLVARRGSHQLGAVGTATYTLLHEDRAWWKLLETLGDFALYSGVGLGTTSGMGQVRRVAT